MGHLWHSKCRTTHFPAFNTSASQLVISVISFPHFNLIYDYLDPALLSNKPWMIIQNIKDLLQHLALLGGCSFAVKFTIMAQFYIKYCVFPQCRVITTGHVLTLNLKTFSFSSLFIRAMSLFQLTSSLHIGHTSISLVLIIGFLYGPAVSNDQDF